MERTDELKERIRQQPLNEKYQNLVAWVDSLLKQLADAQATIAALQARVQELEAIKIPDDAFTYCAYCGEKSPVDEHNEDLSAHIKVCPKHPMRDVESQLTQRTAELEAAKRERDVWYARYNELSGVKDRQLNDLQAELERVRAVSNPCSKIFTHKWLDPECVENGCQSLKLKHRQGMEG